MINSPLGDRTFHGKKRDFQRLCPSLRSNAEHWPISDLGHRLQKPTIILSSRQLRYGKETRRRYIHTYFQSVTDQLPDQI